jgi:hypothetical protein
MAKHLENANPTPQEVGIKYQDDPTERQMVSFQDTGKKDLAELEALYDGIVKDLETGSSNISITIMQADTQIPVCLSGIGTLNYQTENQAKHALCCIAILPEEKVTNILLATANEHSQAAALHVSDETSPSVLAMLESWMVFGSDHWFIRPSAWEAMSDARQQALCDSIMTLESIFDEVPFSILDGARQSVVDEIKRVLAAGDFNPQHTQRIHDILKKEESKLNYPLKG